MIMLKVNKGGKLMRVLCLSVLLVVIVLSGCQSTKKIGKLPQGKPIPCPVKDC